MLRFLLVFLTIQLTLFGLSLVSWVQTHVVVPWTSFLASFCAKLVLIFDSTAAATGKVLWNTVSGFGVSIEAGCNGLEAFIILIAAVMAFPASWKDKLIGLVAGFFAIQILNVVRVISLFYIGQWNKEIFDFAHHYVWQALIMLDVLVFWLLWAGWSAKQKQKINNQAYAAHV